MTERRLSDRIVDGFAVGFAAWTLVCQAAIALALPFRVLVPAGLVVLVALAALCATLRRSRPSTSSTSQQPIASPSSAETTALERGAIDRHFGLWLFAAAAVAGAGLLPISPELKWRALAAYAVAAAAASLRDWIPAVAPYRGVNHDLEARRDRAVLLLALAGGLLATAYVEPNPDDSGYVNLVVAPVDHPEAPIFQTDTMHGIAGTGPLFPVYRLHSLEAAAAAAAWLFSLPADVVVYRVLPFVLGMLCVLAHARFARSVGGAWWPWILGVMLVLSFGTATGPFSGVRALRHGKASLFLVAIPLVVAYAVDYMARPTARRWLRLAAAQVAAIGLSATGLWAAPPIAAATLTALWRPERDTTRRWAIGLGASAYLVFVGLLLFPASRAQLASLPELSATAASGMWAGAVRHGLGSAALQWTCFAATALAIPLATSGLARRVVLALVLACVVLLVSPLLSPWIAASVTGKTTYWRAFRVFPAQLCVAMVAIAPILWSERRARGWRVAAISATCLLVGAIVLSSPRVLPAWPPSLDPFAQSPYEEEHAVARVLTEHTAAGDAVLAPESVAQWTTTFHEPPRPLVVRKVYLYVLSPQIARDEYERRLDLEAYVAGTRRRPSSRARLAESLRNDRLAAVVLAGGAPWLGEMQRTLLRAGWQVAGPADSPRYELWLPPSLAGAGGARQGRLSGGAPTKR